MKKLNKILMAAPVAIFFLTSIVSSTLIFFDYLSDRYLYLILIICEILRPSFAFNLILLVLCIKMRLCLYSYVAVISLMVLNVLNVVALSPILIGDFYYETLTVCIFIVSSFLIVGLKLKENGRGSKRH